MERLRSKLRPRGGVGHLYPSIETELEPFRKHLKGRVLNAGAGNRDLSHLVDGELVNQDIPSGHHPGHIDIWAPLDEIPVADGHFDTVLCNAVLEHVVDPERVMAEFARVIRPGGALVLGVPFLQPEHLDPTDGQRYTADGLREICARHGFEVVETSIPHAVETTLGWIVYEWLQEESRIRALLFGRAWYGWLARQATRSSRRVHAIADAYVVVATKP